MFPVHAFEDDILYTKSPTNILEPLYYKQKELMVPLNGNYVFCEGVYATLSEDNRKIIVVDIKKNRIKCIIDNIDKKDKIMLSSKFVSVGHEVFNHSGVLIFVSVYDIVALSKRYVFYGKKSPQIYDIENDDLFSIEGKVNFVNHKIILIDDRVYDIETLEFLYISKCKKFAGNYEIIHETNLLTLKNFQRIFGVEIVENGFICPMDDYILVFHDECLGVDLIHIF